MRLSIGWAILGCVVGVNACADDDLLEPAKDLLPPSQIMVAGEPMVVEGFASPCVGDFDGDGRLDLLVGQRGEGRLRIYLNVGTNEKPRFDSFKWFEAGGRIACVPSCCVTTFSPRLVDFDGDRDLDILTGSGRGTLFLFRRGDNGIFSAAEVLVDNTKQTLFVTSFRRANKPRRYSYNSAVFPHDWDSDGDLDLVIGTKYGISRNTGTTADPVFQPTQPILVDGMPLSHGIPPCIADWDGDGLPDLLIGDRKKIVWHRNDGQPAKPIFGKPLLLVRNESEAAYKAGRYGFHGIDVVDFNGDGKVDLLVGDSLAKKNESYQEPTDDERAAYRAFSRDFRDLAKKKLTGDESHERIIEHHRALLDQWQRLAERFPKRTLFEGRVWLYVRSQ